MANGTATTGQKEGHELQRVLSTVLGYGDTFS